MRQFMTLSDQSRRCNIWSRLGATRTFSNLLKRKVRVLALSLQVRRPCAAKKTCKRLNLSADQLSFGNGDFPDGATPAVAQSQSEPFQSVGLTRYDVIRRTWAGRRGYGDGELSSNADTQLIDKNRSEALQRYRQIVGVLVERPPDQRLPSEAKLSLEELGQYDLLVGKYAGLLPVLDLPSNAAFGETALLGALALQAGRTKVAAHIYEEVNFGTSNVSALAYVMQGVGAFLVITVLLFLLSCLMLLVLDATVFHEADLSYLLRMEPLTSKPMKVLIGTFFGCCGGVVSLLLQLPHFEVLKGKSRTFLRALGGTQPVIGGIFAFVLGALISAKIINLSVGSSSDLSPWLFVVLGFLAGFSERFTRNLLHVAESHFGGATDRSPQPPQQGP
jgi:hypothetical protein